MKLEITFTIAIAVFVGQMRPVSAGVVDTPIPAPFTQHVFTVPGVMATTTLATMFHCTNLDAQAVTIGVELFGDAGGGPYNDAAATSASVAIGATVLFGTSPLVGAIPGDLDLGGGGMGRGSARILATSKKIACTAAVLDPVNAPPTSGWHLTIIAKTKQKAAN
jgi:hypothetical protein